MRSTTLPSKHKNHGVHLRLHLLEDRAVPATFTVNTLEDSAAVPGKFSLRDAIHAANNATPGPHLITFDLSASDPLWPRPGMVGLKTALAPIACNVTIDGLGLIDVARSPFGVPADPDGPPPVTPMFRIFLIGAGADVVLKDIGVLTGEVIGDGGGILNNGTLVLDGARVRNNSAGGDGGAVMNNGSLTLTRAVIQDNSAGDSGGGILNSWNGTLGITGSTIQRNSAGGDGGGFVYSKHANFAITDSFVRDNIAARWGGGMYVDASGANVWLTNTFVTGNRSTGAAGKGGGIYVNEANLVIAGGGISENRAKGDGGGLFAGTGALLQANQVSISGNQTDGNGGGVALNPSVLQVITFSQCTFLLNWTNDLVTGKGGGLYISSESGGGLVLSRCTFDRNAAALGGGLYTADDTDIYGCRFLGNQASVAGGGILGGWARLTLHFYVGPDGVQVPNVFQGNQAPQGMGPGIGWIVAGGGTLSWPAGAYTGGDMVDLIN